MRLAYRLRRIKKLTVDAEKGCPAYEIPTLCTIHCSSHCSSLAAPAWQARLGACAGPRWPCLSLTGPTTAECCGDAGPGRVDGNADGRVGQHAASQRFRVHAGLR